MTQFLKSMLNYISPQHGMSILMSIYTFGTEVTEMHCFLYSSNESAFTSLKIEREHLSKVETNS